MEECSKFGIVISEDDLCIFMRYLEELKKWNNKINLTAMTNDTEIIVKHFLDSILPLSTESITIKGSLLDIGSGGGFPGIPLKILNKSIKILLLEPNQKKSAFLRYVSGVLNLENVTIRSENFEKLSMNSNFYNVFNVIVTRAISLKNVIPFIYPLLHQDGHVILYRTRPLGNLDVTSGLRISREVQHALPFNFGTRYLTILTPC